MDNEGSNQPLTGFYGYCLKHFVKVIYLVLIKKIQLMGEKNRTKVNVSLEMEAVHLEFQRQEIHENYHTVKLSSIW